MSRIVFVPRADLNVAAYDTCVQATPGAMVFGQSWYLDALTGQSWAALVMGDYEAVLPLPVKKKWGLQAVYMPFFCQQLGLYGAESFLNLSVFLQNIPRRFIRINLHLQNRYAADIKLNMRTNFMLNLNRKYEELKAGFAADAHKNLRKCEQAGIAVSEELQIAETIALYRQVWGPLNPGITDVDYNRFQMACEMAENHGQITGFVARLEGEVLARAIFLKDHEHIHYVCAAPSGNGKKFGVMHVIIDQAVRQYANSGLWLNFEGSEIPGVAAFYQKFAAVNVPYLSYSKKLL